MDVANLQPEQLQSIVNDAVQLFHQGEHGRSESILTELIECDVSFPGLHYLRACCFIHLGRLSLVVNELGKEVETHGPLPEAVGLLSQINAQAQVNPTLRGLPTTQGRFVICGLSPGGSGTGRFLEALIPVGRSAGFSEIHPLPGASFSMAERLLIGTIKNSDVVLLHPQTMGFSTFRSLCENGNRISMYVLDSSFFCIRSLNYRPNKAGECLDCVGNLGACHSSCQPFPASASKAENIQFLEWLRTFSPSIHFLCQTEHQAKLVGKHFGENVRRTVVGMRTDEFKLTKEGSVFDLVFHGEELNAKGLRYVIELARALPELTVLIPAERSLVLREASSADGKEIVLPSNVVVQNLRWESGLSEHVAACRLVLCPSQWSAPVEGALLKSLFFNGNVAVCESSFGFERELPQDLTLRLSIDPMKAAASVREFLAAEICHRERARRWVQEYRKRVNLAAVFTPSADPSKRSVNREDSRCYRC